MTNQCHVSKTKRLTIKCPFYPSKLVCCSVADAELHPSIARVLLSIMGRIYDLQAKTFVTSEVSHIIFSKKIIIRLIFFGKINIQKFDWQRSNIDVINLVTMSY